MITPLIHRALTREDLAQLVAEIGRLDQAEARAAEEAIQAGAVDSVLDSPVALDARLTPFTPLWARAAGETEALQAALAEARRDYLGRDVHSAHSRLERFLGRLN